MDTNIISGIISAGATLITGAFVIGIYLWQKRDSKIQAARVLLTEIRIAEEKIDQTRDILESNQNTDLPIIFPSKNWKNYSHLFISDFDQDELKLINSFYDFGEIIEDFAIRNNNFFWITTEERAKVTVNEVANLSHDVVISKRNEEDIKSSMSTFDNALDKHNLPYVPSKTKNEIKKYLSRIPKITTSSCGQKLKKIARLTNRKKILGIF
jgi:hypothetical protein